MRKFLKALGLFIGLMMMFTGTAVFYGIGINLFGTPFVVGMVIVCLVGLFYYIYTDMT